MKELPSTECLMEMFSYSPDTGKLTRRSDGREAGFIERHGYRRVKIVGRQYYVHRIIWKIATGVDLGDAQIDHVNGDRTDNRLSNLRLATQSENQHNKGQYKSNTSGFPGVWWDKKIGKFRAEIKLNGERIYLGVFDDAVEGYESYANAKARLHITSPKVRETSHG